MIHLRRTRGGSGISGECVYRLGGGVEAEQGDTSNDDNGRDKLPLVKALGLRDATKHIMAHDKDQDGPQGLQDPDRNVVDPGQEHVIVQGMQHGRDGQQRVHHNDARPVGAMGFDHIHDLGFPVGDRVHTEINEREQRSVASDHRAHFFGNRRRFKRGQDFVRKDIDACVEKCSSQGDQCPKRLLQP